MFKFSRDLLKEGDQVVLLSGKEKGKVGKLLTFDRKRGMMIVEGLNMRTHFNKEGGLTKKEAWIHRCKVMYFDVEKQQKSKLTRNEKGERVMKEKKNVSKR